MYRQNTNFVAANTPLLQQLFGFQPLEPSPSIAVATQAQDSQYHTGKHHLTPRPSPPGHTKSAVGPPPFFSVVEDCPGEISPCVDPRVPQSEGSMRCGEFSSVERANDNDVSDDNDALVKAEPALPFRQVMQELERRFHEQMEVHRVLNSTMDRLDTLQAEVSLYQAEQRTLKLAAALREVNALPVDASVQAFAGAQKHAEASTHVSPPSATAPTDAGSAPAQGDKSSAAANPLLTSILESYEKERESRLRAKRGATADTAQKEEKPPLDIIRPPEAPRPYKRVYYVPIEDATTQTPEDVGAEVADDSALTGSEGSVKSYISELSSRSTIVTEDVEVLQSDQPSDDEGVVTDIATASSMEDTVIDSSSVVTSQDDGSEPTSVHTSFISTSSSISTQSVSDGTAIVAHSSTTEEVEDMYDSVISEIGAKEITEDNVDPLVEALKEFHNTCRNTNQLMQVLLRSDIRHTHPPGKPEESAGREESDSDDSSSTHSSEDPRDESQVKEEPKYFDTLQRNVKDIRKLRRFIDHIRKNIKHIDCYRKAKEVRRKLFVKAQRLAKARRRMKHDEAALSDVMDDIADIIQSDIDAAADEDDVVDDISVALSAEASDSIMDEVDDDLYGSVAGEDDIADEVQDEVVDGSQSSAFDEVGDEAVVGAESEQSWGEVESEFAAALAEASDVEDLLEDEVPLDDEIPVDEVASAAVRTDESVGDDVVIDDEGVDDVVDDVEDAVPSMESIEESDAEDADVSTVLPISSDSSRSTSTDQRAASVARAYDDTESAESALDALERDMAETAGYRAHLVTTITPTTFTEMYVPDARSTDVHIAGDEAKSLLSDSVDVKSLAAVDRVSTTLTTWPRLEAFVASPSNSVSPVEQSVAQQSATTGASSASVAGLPRQTSRRSAYPTDDLLAQVAWKERQLRLFEKIRPKPELALEETEEPQDEAEGFVEGRAEYHWSMLETLLQHRFGSGGGIADGLDDYSDEYDSDEDDHSYDAYGSSLSGAFAGLSARGGVRDGVLADAEYSGK